MDDAREALVAQARAGAVTLVLGAGVSRSRGVPSWRELVRTLWSAHVGELPDWLADRPDPAVRDPHPLANAIALERVAATMEREGEGRFVEELRAALYEPSRDAEPSPQDSLTPIAEVIRADHARGERRILRVVTFNADDLLEVECNAGCPPHEPIVHPIASEAGCLPARGGRRPIPIYHVHGYLPRASEHTRIDALTFTDAQYWASVASPLSFANRVMANALHDGTCVFIGVSMSDVDLMRWLGVRYRALAECEGTQVPSHFWVRRAADDRGDFIGWLLARRGVRSVAIDDWADDFHRLMRACFPE